MEVTQEKTLKLQKADGSFKYKIHIPAKVEKQIRFLCSQVSTIEWSGVLIYTYEGSFENNDLVINCEDIYLMDVGNATYTEFNISPDVIAYMTDNCYFDGYYTGLVHSHHSMKAFFSDTDTSTLASEGTDTNNFVSLIVNNAGEYTAAITRKFKTVNEVHSIYTASTFDEEGTTGEKVYTQEVEYLEYYPLIIDKEPVETGLNELSKRLADIKSSKVNNYKTYPLFNNNIPVQTSPASTPKYDTFGDYLKDKRTVEEDTPVKKVQPQIEEEDEEMLFNEYLSIDVSKDVLDVMLNRILLCNPLANSKTIDRNTWVKNMTKVLDKAFFNMQGYSEYIESLIEYLTAYTEDEKMMIYEVPYIQGVYAANLINMIEELDESNLYLDEILECLYKYIV